MIATARRQAREANLPVHFEIADLYGLHYPEHSFDYLFLTNIAYSLLIPRRLRTRFLKPAYSVLKPGGFFIVSFATRDQAPQGVRSLEPVLTRLSRLVLFNKEYEAGDAFLLSTFIHLFQEDALRGEFEEAEFVIKQWLWREGYAVLAKVDKPDRLR